MMDNARTSEPQTTKGTQASVQQQEARFHELLQHVWKHSPFYRDCYESFGIREKDLPHLNVSNLPFLTKKALMENFDQAVSDSRLKKRELEQWIQDTPNPSQIYRDNFVVLHTSGSSGAIAIFVYDLYAWRLMNGTISTLDLLPRPENLDVGKTRLALFLATHGHFAGVTTSAMLPKSVYDVCAISLLDSTEHAVTQLNKF